MAKPFPKFGPYNIIADTNALRAQDSRKLVSSGFEAALAELRKLATIQLHIPDVVIGELAYQKFEMAATSIDTITNNLRLLGDIIGPRRTAVLSHGQAKNLISKKYKAWCKTAGVRRIVPRIRQASWNKIVNDAVWRIAPFERSEDRKHEKGFRDRVVLEAVAQMCSNAEIENVLLTEDGMLSKALSSCGMKNLLIVPRLEDFTSRVRLLKEKAESEWVEVFFDGAKRAFYTKDNQDCLYWKAKIYQHIAERVEDLQPPPADALSVIFEPKKWDKQTEEIITLGTTQYEKHDTGRVHWKTNVMSAAAFSGKGILGALAEKIRISTFAVHWSSQAVDDAEIKGAEFGSIALAGRQMIPDTAEARTQWSLPAKPLPTFPGLAELLKAGLPSTPTK